MSAWLIVWFIVAAVTAAAMISFLIALVRHVLLLGRTARRMQEEIAPIAQEITSGVDRASDKASSLRPPTFGPQRP